MTLLALVSAGIGHGYGIRREIERRRMERWADISMGSIYGGLRRLEDGGLIEETGQEDEGKGPPRTIYRITEEGRSERDRLIREHLASPALPADPVDAALSFFVFLESGEIVALLEERLGTLEACLERQDRREETVGTGRPQIDAMIEDLFAHGRGRLEHEIRWTRRVIERIRDGRYDLDPADLQRPNPEGRTDG